MNYQGKLITLEGVDGAGKSTNLQVICAFLKEDNIPFVQTREPGGTAFGEQIRDIVLNKKYHNMCVDAELLLILSARSQHIHEVILPALQKGLYVLCDRFSDATYAYQGSGRNIDLNKIKRLEQSLSVCIVPDLTILLDLSVETSEKRTDNRGELDRFEVQNNEFKQKVRKAYRQLATKYPQRIKTVNAENKPLQVAKDIRTHLTTFFKEHG